MKTITKTPQPTIGDIPVVHDQSDDTYDIKKPLNADEVISLAKFILGSRAVRGEQFNSPTVSKSYAQIHYGGLEQEQFACLFLDAKHRLIAHETLFYGTVDSAAVYPREVVKRAIAHNTSATILIHNHPSGDATPSRADIAITEQLVSALSLLNISVIDHLIVGSEEVVSLAETGQLHQL